VVVFAVSTVLAALAAVASLLRGGRTTLTTEASARRTGPEPADEPDAQPGLLEDTRPEAGV
jgi:hypothetical protein